MSYGDYFLTDATLELLEIVFERGTQADRAKLRPFEHYLWSLDPRQLQHNQRHDDALEDLQDLVMEISAR